MAYRFLCVFVLLALEPAVSAQAQSTLKNQPGTCSTEISCTLSLTTGSGNITFAAVVGPNCRLGQSCSFPSGYVGTYFAYHLPDGSSGDTGNFSGVLTYIGVSTCGLQCSTYYYTMTGTFWGQDSQGRAFTGSTRQAMAISSRSRGGDNAMDTGGATTLTFTGGPSTTPAALAFLTVLPSALAPGDSIGAVMVGVEDSGGNIVTSSAADITVSLTGPAGFDSVTQTASASHGVAAFALPGALTIAGQYTLSASSTGLAPAPNAVFSVDSSKAGPQTPDFSLTASPTTLTVRTGQSAMVNVTLVPVGGLTGTQTFSCSGLPASTNCCFAPPILNADGSNTPLTTQMAITTASGAMSTPRRNHLPPRRREAGYVFFALLLPGVFFWPKRARKEAQRLLLVAFVLIALIGGISCGASQSATRSNTSPMMTVVVTATSSNGVSHSTNINLVLTQ